MSKADSSQVTSQGLQTTHSPLPDLLSHDFSRRPISEFLERLVANHGLPKADQVKLDLGQVERITSESLNKLIQLNSLARNRGIRLVLVDVQDLVREVFALTRLERMFEFESSGESSPTG